MNVLGSLLTEANKLLAEVRDERDRARQESADLRKALTDEQNLSAELLAEHEVRESHLVVLRTAIVEGDPRAELLVRIDDMLRETRAIITRAQGGS